MLVVKHKDESKEELCFLSYLIRFFTKMRNTIAHTEGGIVKRIDENRELLELLQKEAPKLLESHPWIEWWIKSHDTFFTELKNAEENPDVHFSERPNIFPRPWPVSK